MEFISTRDKSVVVSGAQAIAQGISKESGLFVPRRFPKTDMAFLRELVENNYIQRAQAVLALFLPDFTPQEIRESVVAAYGTGFADPAVAPVKKLNDTAYMLELWHGPTCAFKDMALQLLPQLLTRSLAKVAKGKEAVILVATSGDTGKAALEGFRDVEGTRMIVFYPEGGVSRIQELQMVTQEGNNLEVVSVVGNFDDTQTGVKSIFSNRSLAKEIEEKNLLFSSANSINWGRLMPQIVYYFSAYVDLVKAQEITLGDTVNVCVPTGNFGNILAAYYAKKMGLPLGKLLCASNENHVLTDFFETGIYNANREFKLTASPSMDILISSNLERLLFALSGEDDGVILGYMQALAQKGQYEISTPMKQMLDEEFYAGYLTDEQTSAVIARTFQTHGYLCDTHTAVAIGVYERYKEQTGDNTKTIIASTANPYKFAGNILPAIAPEAAPADAFETLALLHEKTNLPIPPQILALESKPVRFTKVVLGEGMEQVVREALGLSSE